MKNLLLNCFQRALTSYQQKESRGYNFGFFSHKRHAFSKTAKLVHLEKKLLANKNDDEAIYIIIEHFLEKSATFNHHSFNEYLIDSLKEFIPHIDWNCFTPTAIKKYQGCLYRGSSQPPEKIFNEGFRELKSSILIDDYLKYKTGSIGVSTSKDFSCALKYAQNNKRSGKTRYIYSINYRGKDGYDISATGKARGLTTPRPYYFNYHSRPDKHEVNIKNGVNGYDIIGAWQLKENLSLQWIENSTYSTRNSFTL